MAITRPRHDDSLPFQQSPWDDKGTLPRQQLLVVHSCLQPVCPWCVPMYKSNPNWPLGWRCREVREMGIRVSSTGYPGGLPASFPISCTNRHWFLEVLVYFFLLLRVRRIYISDFPEKRAILNQPSKSLEYRMFIPSKLRKHVENESIPFKFSSWLLLVPISLPS